MGLAQMERIEELVERRRHRARLYNKLLSSLADEELVLPKEEQWAKSVYWMYSILVKDSSIRDELMQTLDKAGIETRTFFYPVHKQPYYSSRFADEDFPVADDISKRGINLPSGNGLTDEEVSFVCQSVVDFFRKN